MVSKSASSPARWPSVLGRPRLVAQRPLPSMTQATWAGMRWGSSPPRSTRSPYRLRLPQLRQHLLAEQVDLVEITDVENLEIHRPGPGRGPFAQPVQDLAGG